MQLNEIYCSVEYIAASKFRVSVHKYICRFFYVCAGAGSMASPKIGVHALWTTISICCLEFRVVVVVALYIIE